MEDNATNHALTEVALALAMAFFAIMILAMVSMGMPSDTAKPPPLADLPKDAVVLAQLKEAAEKSADSIESQADDTEQTYLFYFNDHFYDHQLKPISLDQLPPGGKVVLALPPSLTVDKAMNIQAKINHPDLVITQLNPQWLQRLETL